MCLESFLGGPEKALGTHPGLIMHLASAQDTPLLPCLPRTACISPPLDGHRCPSILQGLCPGPAAVQEKEQLVLWARGQLGTCQGWSSSFGTSLLGAPPAFTVGQQTPSHPLEAAWSMRVLGAHGGD